MHTAQSAASGNTPGSLRREDLSPHFEDIGGRKVFYVDGWPFTILTAEITWLDLVHGRYRETLHAYDHLYPAAARLGLNTLKVPIKWSMVEPERGVYDFSYLEHVKATAERHGLKLVVGWFGHYASGDGTIYRNLRGEVYAPMYVIEDTETYPRAVDADGVAHHNAVSYDYEPVIEAETAAFRAFMRRIREIDAQTRTILMVQVENEIAVFGADRQNAKHWRDHSPASERFFREGGYTDDLRYSAERFSGNWLRRLTEAGHAEYPIPFFVNFVGGKLADWMTGGAPGEDVATYMKNCPRIAYAGLNHYASPDESMDDARAVLGSYRVGRNLVAVTETNSDPGPLAPRLAFLATGEFGAPIFAPWALDVSCPMAGYPYVTAGGEAANGAFALRESYLALGRILPHLAYYGGTERLKVFVRNHPGEAYRETKEVGGVPVTVTGEEHGDGQAIVVSPAPGEFIIAAFRCGVTIPCAAARWPELREIEARRVAWRRGGWMEEQGEPFVTIDQSRRQVHLWLHEPQAVRVRWPE
ncbi:MAG: hypothetical protein ACM3X6_11385 [Patescibacteria group bacterium]